jgi:hypothetical protein
MSISQIDHELVAELPSSHIKKIYDSYSDMLYGYILKMAVDEQQADNYLIEVFMSLSREFGPHDFEVINSWPFLLRCTKRKLLEFNASFPDAVKKRAKILNLKNEHPDFFYLSEIQMQVFNAVYYRIKSVDDIAQEYKKPADEIRRILRTTIYMIRMDKS